MSKLRQTIPARQARAGVRPGTTAQHRAPTAAAPSQAQQQDKRLEQIVDQGGVGVWRVKGNDTPIYALSREQAQAEAQRRGVKGELSLSGYVKLSDADRASLQQTADAGSRRKSESSRATAPRRSLSQKAEDRAATRPSNDPEDIYKQTLARESLRRQRKDEYAPSELIAREQRAKEAGEKLAADREARDAAQAKAARVDAASSALKSYEVAPNQYDISTALLKGSVSAQDLLDLGFSVPDVNHAMQYVSMSSFPEVRGQKASAKATLGKSGAELFAGSPAKAGAGETDMRSVKPSPTSRQASVLSGVLLLPFRNRDGTYNLQRMIESGKVSAKVMRNAGFTDAQITDAILAAMRSSAARGTQATVGGLTAFAGTGATGKPGASVARVDPNNAEPVSTGAKASATRNLLLFRYQNDDATYDLQKAIEGKVSVRSLRTAGFTDAQILAAINAAMADLGATQKRQMTEATGTPQRQAIRPEMTQQERIDALAKVMGEINKQVELDIVSAEGKARDILRESQRTSVALPGEERTWYHVPTGATISDQEYRKATNDGQNAEADEYALSVRSARRLIVTGLAPVLFSAARVALPETDRSEVPLKEWVRSTAQLATWVLPFVPKGAATALELGAGSVFLADTADNWAEMSTGERALGVAVSTALLAGGAAGVLQPSLKPVKVPLKDGGEAVVWRGLTLRGKPIVGITKLPPNIDDVAVGWRPITQTEKTLLGTERMLKQMGVPDEQVQALMKGYRETKAFQPLRSPYEPKGAKAGEFAPQSLTPDEFGTVLKHTVKSEKQVAEVYGSTTIKMQLDPKLRNWRKLGDVEVQLKPGVTEQQAAKLADDILADLNKNAPGKFRIDPSDPKRILVTGGHHAVELKLAEVSKLGVEAQYSLTRTGEMSWGMKVAQKPITVDFPGVGKLRIMRLSESGVRKFDSISRHAGSGKFAPAEHRTKDIIDYYVILRTFKGETVADDWARLYGLDPKQAAKAALEDPPKLDAWEFIPGKGRVRAGASPSVTVTLPPSMAAYVKAQSPALYKRITAPVSPAAAASTAARQASPASAGSVGAAPSTRSPAFLSSPESTAPETDASSPRTASLPADDEESPSSSSPSPQDKTPSPSLATPSPDTASPSPGPVPPSPGGSHGGGGGAGIVPPPYSPSRSTGGTSKPRKGAALSDQAERSMEDTGRVQWKQGAYWIMVEPPPTEGERQRNVQYSRRPFWGVRKVKGSPEETFAKQGKPPKQFLYEMGIAHASIHSYEKPHLRWRQTRKAKRPRGRVM